MIRLFFLLVIFFPGFFAKAQEYNYVHYGLKDGLPGAVVYTMVQDKDGFMWFGTESGLSRFDGTWFTNFTTEDGLPDNEILRLFVDSRNRVWIAPFKNEICYYWRGKIFNKDNDSLLKKLSIEHRVIAVKENLQGDIFILEQCKLHIIKPDGQIKVIRQCSGFSIYHSFGAGFSNAGNFRIIGLLTTSDVSKDHGELTVCEVKRDSLLLKGYHASGSNSENSVYLSPDLDIVRRHNKLVFYHNLTGKRDSIPLPDGLIKVSRLNDSLVAISTQLYCKIYNLYQQQYGSISFKKKNASTVVEDKEGNFWFATLGDGVYRLVSSEVLSYKFEKDGDCLPVYSLLKSGNILFAGSDNYDLLSVDLINHRISNRKLVPWGNVGKIVTLNVLPEGDLLVGADDAAFAISDDKVTRFGKNFVSIKSVQLCSDTVLIGSINGAYWFMHGRNNQPVTLWNGRVTTIYRQPPYFYVGTLNGLYRIDEKRKTSWLGELHTSFQSRIAAISAGHDGTVWIATHGAGVIGYKNDKITTHFTMQNGLASNNCRALLVQDSVVWAGTDKGLSKIKFEGDTFGITHYTYTDGLSSDIINAITVDNGIVYVATAEGITFFNEGMLFERSICALNITGIRSNSQYWLYDTTGLHFPHNDNNIRFEFSGISFRSAGNITYNYRMVGIDENWSHTKEQFLAYQALPSGNYTLQLMATNKFGVRSEIKEISFTIEKLIWEKNWFRLLMLAALIFLVWLFVNIRIKKIRRADAAKAETNRKIAELEQMALKAQMNPHFIFNSLNSIQHYVIQKDIKGANKFIADFSRLIRLTLDISSKYRINLGEEISYITTYMVLEQKRFEHKFNYGIQIADNVDVAECHIPAMILQPYIENSIRHGIRYRNDDGGIIAIEFYKDRGYLVCTITDNGVGRAFSKQVKGKLNIEYQSKGMSLTAKRIEMMNRSQVMPTYVNVEDLYDDKGNSLGTKVFIRFPENEIKKPV